MTRIPEVRPDLVTLFRIPVPGPVLLMCGLVGTGRTGAPSPVLRTSSTFQRNKEVRFFNNIRTFSLRHNPAQTAEGRVARRRAVYVSLFLIHSPLFGFSRSLSIGINVCKIRTLEVKSALVCANEFGDISLRKWPIVAGLSFVEKQPIESGIDAAHAKHAGFRSQAVLNTLLQIRGSRRAASYGGAIKQNVFPERSFAERL